MTTAVELIGAGDLAGARAAAAEAVKRDPTDPAARFALAEVLVLLGEWERADGHLDLASDQDPSWGPAAALQRQLLRAALHREEVFAAGRAPDLVTESGPEIETALRVLLAARTGASRTGAAPAGEDAAALRAARDAEAPDLRGEADGRAFDALRDGDDRTAEVLEVLTPTGKYVWAAWSAVVSLELAPVRRPRDLVWRPAELELRGGPSGAVHLPMIYPPPPGAQPTPAQRLGRETDWTEHAGLTCGLGQRCLLMGDDLASLAGVSALSVAPPAAG